MLAQNNVIIVFNKYFRNTRKINVESGYEWESTNVNSNDPTDAAFIIVLAMNENKDDLPRGLLQLCK
ncbi:Hypothetical protein HVR_LOCUS557 [uncultured virus]|nr:Hypothetical protein HVR_LOCUS557 [uncultured virus]